MAPGGSLKVDIEHDWPYAALVMGLAAATYLLSNPRAGRASWWLRLALPLYQIHQFEEHGIDLHGERYAFIRSLCAGLGHPDLATCPATPSFITAVNVGAVWIAGGLGALLADSHPGVGAGFLGVIAVNAAIHLVGAALTTAYNPGVGTSVILFLPIAYGGFREVRRGVRRLGPGLPLLLGVLVHAVIIGGLKAHAAGRLSAQALWWLQIANGFVPAFAELA